MEGGIEDFCRCTFTSKYASDEPMNNSEITAATQSAFRFSSTFKSPPT
jgi:hypothetical protein